MKIIALFTIALLISACSSVNVNSDNRSVDCSEFISRGDGTNKSINIVTTDGKSLNVVAVGSAREPQQINFKYGKGCYIDLVRDVKRIERIDDSSQKVSLINGRTIEIGTYDTKWKLKGTPYNKSPWSVIVETSSGVVDYHSEKIDPFRNLSHLTILNTPVKQSSLNALSALKFKEQEAYELKRKQDAYEREQRRLQREEERRKAEEAERRRQAEEARLEQEKRDWAKMSISRSDNIGRKICKDGMLEYSWYTGYVILGQPQYRDSIEKGQIQGYLEGFSQDGYRVKFRVSGWATDTGRLRFNPAQAPRLEEFSAQQGAIYWDDVKEWFLCN